MIITFYNYIIRILSSDNIHYVSKSINTVEKKKFYITDNFFSVMYHTTNLQLDVFLNKITFLLLCSLIFFVFRDHIKRFLSFIKFVILLKKNVFLTPLCTKDLNKYLLNVQDCGINEINFILSFQLKSKDIKTNLYFLYSNFEKYIELYNIFKEHKKIIDTVDTSTISVVVSKKDKTKYQIKYQNELPRYYNKLDDTRLHSKPTSELIVNNLKIKNSKKLKENMVVYKDPIERFYIWIVDYFLKKKNASEASDTIIPDILKENNFISKYKNNTKPIKRKNLNVKKLFENLNERKLQIKQKVHIDIKKKTVVTNKIDTFTSYFIYSIKNMIKDLDIKLISNIGYIIFFILIAFFLIIYFNMFSLNILQVQPEQIKLFLKNNLNKVFYICLIPLIKYIGLVYRCLLTAATDTFMFLYILCVMYKKVIYSIFAIHAFLIYKDISKLHVEYLKGRYEDKTISFFEYKFLKSFAESYAFYAVVYFSFDSHVQKVIIKEPEAFYDRIWPTLNKCRQIERQYQYYNIKNAKGTLTSDEKVIFYRLDQLRFPTKRVFTLDYSFYVYQEKFNNSIFVCLKNHLFEQSFPLIKRGETYRYKRVYHNKYYVFRNSLFATLLGQIVFSDKYVKQRTKSKNFRD
jgi:hypothetical protein